MSQAMTGLFGIIFLAWLTSSNRRRFPLRLVVTGLLAQLVLVLCCVMIFGGFVIVDDYNGISLESPYAAGEVGKAQISADGRTAFATVNLDPDIDRLWAEYKRAGQRERESAFASAHLQLAQQHAAVDQCGELPAIEVAVAQDRVGLAAGLGDLPLFAAAIEHRQEVVDTLRERLGALDIDALSPREALDLLYELKREAGKLP